MDKLAVPLFVLCAVVMAAAFAFVPVAPWVAVPAVLIAGGLLGLLSAHYGWPDWSVIVATLLAIAVGAAGWSASTARPECEAACVRVSRSSAVYVDRLPCACGESDGEAARRGGR